MNMMDTWNPYAYCAGNPVVYTDPSGHNPLALPVVMQLLAELATSAAIVCLIVIGATVVINGSSGSDHHWEKWCTEKVEIHSKFYCLHVSLWESFGC